jgi:hypothetical protein
MPHGFFGVAKLMRKGNNTKYLAMKKYFLFVVASPEADH